MVARHESEMQRKRGDLLMKKDIHPKYNKAVVRCVCGETFETGSIKKEMRVDICSKCHPFYTGKQKLVDSVKNTCLAFPSYNIFIIYSSSIIILKYSLKD